MTPKFQGRPEVGRYLSPNWLVRGLAAFAAIGLTGCTTAPSPGETQARHDVAAVGSALGIGSGGRPDRHAESAAAGTTAAASLTANSTEADYVRFALYRHPAVRAAYYDWQASVHAIAPARSLPDPQLTFQADIADTLMSFMPGLMADIMGPGKRAAMAREATAMSDVAYRTYVAEVVKTAANVRKAWIELAYAQDTDRLFQRTMAAAERAVELASADYMTRTGMANFEQQVRFQNTLAQHHAHHIGVAQRLEAARARFKAALGLLPDDPDPVWPEARLETTPIPPADELWARVRDTNPDLEKMRAMVDAAVASVAVARKGGTPDFTAGLMVDTKQDPLMFRPTATMTLPIWREKIRANIAAAEARREAAAARVTAEQVNMAAQLAQMLYMVREADSMLDYLTSAALPNLDRALASAAAGVQSGMASETMIAETQLMKIDMLHERLDAWREREMAVADLELMINHVLPDRAPLVVTQALP